MELTAVNTSLKHAGGRHCLPSSGAGFARREVEILQCADAACSDRGVPAGDGGRLPARFLRAGAGAGGLQQRGRWHRPNASRRRRYDAIASLRRVLADSPSLCTPSFVANVHKQMEQSLYLQAGAGRERRRRAVLRRAGQGRELFAALRSPCRSPATPRPLEVVRLADLLTPVLKVTQGFGDGVERCRRSCRWCCRRRREPAGRAEADDDGAGGADRRHRDHHGGRPQRFRRPRRHRVRDGGELCGRVADPGRSVRCRSPSCAPTMPISMPASPCVACLMCGGVPGAGAAICAALRPAGLRSRAGHRGGRDQALLPAGDQPADRGAGWLRGAVPLGEEERRGRAARRVHRVRRGHGAGHADDGEPDAAGARRT